MGNRKSLGSIIVKYAIFELLYTFFIMLMFISVFMVLLNKGFLYPAKFADINAVNVERKFKEGDFSTSEIPYFYNYRYIKDGKVIDNTIDDIYNNEVKNAIDKGSAVENRIIGSKVFTCYRDNGRVLILSYNLSAFPASERIYKYLKNFELIYFLLFIIIWISGFALLIKRCIKLIKVEINKIAIANSYIKNLQLDYPKEYTKYTEINDVLNSLDIMAKDLKKSLTKKWEIEKSQRDIIESVTHDIRTPITLIKGNLELIKESADSENALYISDIENGVTRLEVYVNKLKDYSKAGDKVKRCIDENTISYWISNINSLCTASDRVPLILSKDTSDILVDCEAVDIAIQNIIVNAVENSKAKTLIKVDFKDYERSYIISIKDEGRGFSEEILEKASVKNITTKKDSSNHGLGLYIVENVLKNNNGVLEVSNYSDAESKGAEVKMIFYK